MGLLRSALLLGAGAAVGYLASRRVSTPSTDVAIRSSHSLVVAGNSQVAKFFDSPIGKQLQPYALKAVEFASRVREGMNEKEAELHARVERARQDVRPGSLDTWDKPMSANQQERLERDAAERELRELELEIALEERRAGVAQVIDVPAPKPSGTDHP